MNQLWTPPNAKTLPRAGIPEGPVTVAVRTKLSSGAESVREIVLTKLRPWSMPGVLDGAVFQALGGKDPAAMTEKEINLVSRGLRVIATLDEHPEYGRLLHTSFSYNNHLPSWEEVRGVREAFFPETVDAMMVLPRPEFYVNHHPYTFHLWQCPQGWGVR